MLLSKIAKRWFLYGFSILLISLSLFTIFGDRGLLHLWRLWGEKRTLDERNFHLQRENELLRERIHRLRHDNLYLEKIAREDLGLVREGEIVYRFSSESKKNRLSELSSQPPRSSGQKAPR